MAGRVIVGTSSWADPGFVEEWYPDRMPARERLPWYAERFEAVELNSSFYAVPETATVERWAQTTPDGFRFDVKLHRLLSRHSAEPESLPKPMRDGVEVNSRGRVVLTEDVQAALADAFLEATRPLAEAGKLGAFLLQLSPSFSPKRHELEELRPLVERLAPNPLAIELRNRNWVDGDRAKETLAAFADMGAAWVGVDAPNANHFTVMPPVDGVTRDDLAYLRAHGRNAEGYLHGKSVAERFGWRYSDEELEEVGTRAGELAGEADEVHVMFNNNRGADAPVAAQRMRELLGQAAAAPPGGAQPAQMELGGS